MAPSSPTAYETIFKPTIIDLRLAQPTEAKHDFQDSYPSLSSDHDQLHGHRVSHHRQESSHLSDSDPMEGLTDSSSVTEGSSSSSSSTEGSTAGDDVEMDDMIASFKNQDNIDTATSSGFDLRAMILEGLCPVDPTAPKRIPTMVLYDDRGLQLFDDITYLKEYYLTQEEIKILERDADKIVEHIPDNSVVVELGAG
ncbi:hypothetical protein BGZ94_005743 [Podila epigama]|nr:hypothetical protein BGZ94_005743 [Podila epigama]